MAIRLAGNAVLERLGEDEYKRISPSGQQDPTEKGKFSRNEVLAELRGRASGDNLEDRLGSLRDFQQGGGKFTGKAQTLLTDRYGFDFNKKGGGEGGGDDPPSTGPEDPGTPVNPNPPTTDVPSPTQTVTFNWGDINGDNNNVDQINYGDIIQDNSDNSTTYGKTVEKTTFPGSNARNRLYSTGGNMLADPYDVDKTSPTGGLRHTPNSQEFANMWKRTIIDNIA